MITHANNQSSMKNTWGKGSIGERSRSSGSYCKLWQATQEFHETEEKDSKQCCDTTMPESIHTKDESKRGSAFAFIFGVN